MRFVAGNYNGTNQMFVQNSTNDAALSNIWANTSDFKFHSNFKYFGYVGEITTSVDLPAFSAVSYEIPGKKSSSTNYATTKHSVTLYYNLPNYVGANSFVSATVNGNVVCSNTIVQQNGDAIRTLLLHVSGNTVILTINGVTAFDSLPAINVTLGVKAYELLDTEGTDPDALLRIDDGRVTFGRGKFDSDSQFLREYVKSGSDIATTKDKTMSAGLVQKLDSYSYSYYAIRYSYNFDGQSFSIDGHPLPATPSVVYMRSV
jgi:hypothetical protein